MPEQTIFAAPAANPADFGGLSQMDSAINDALAVGGIQAVRHARRDHGQIIALKNRKDLVVVLTQDLLKRIRRIAGFHEFTRISVGTGTEPLTVAERRAAEQERRAREQERRVDLYARNTFLEEGK
jgi:hypothetical protein